MLYRILALLICLAGAGWYVHEQQRAGRLQRVDDLFLDFLASNARERLTQPRADAPAEVVFVRIRQEEAGEYGSWPPPPLDWQTLLKGLRPYDPSVVLVTTPLFWGQPAPDFVPAVADALLPFPSSVLGIEAQLSENNSEGPPFMGDLADVLPRFQRVDGDPHAVPALAALITAPDLQIRAMGEPAILSVRPGERGAWQLPYALRAGDSLLPTALAQTLARHSRSPFSLQRIRLGPGAAASLQQGLFVPLEPSGDFRVDAAKDIPTVNALHLMTGTLADATDAADKAALGKGRIVVIGYDHDSNNSTPRLARLHAQALAQALALPRVRMMPASQQWIVWAAAVLAALWLITRVRRSRAVFMGGLLVFGALLLSFLLFQSSLIWLPPTMPAALLVTGAVVTAVIGRKNFPAKEAPAQTPAP